MIAGHRPRVGSRYAPRYCQISAVALLAFSALHGQPATAADGLDRDVILDIPAQPLSKALLQFGQQAKVQIMLASNSADGQTAKAMKGTLRARTALSTLLSGSGLSYSAKDNTVTVAPAAALGVADSNPFRPAEDKSEYDGSQHQTGSTPVTGRDKGTTEDTKSGLDALEEVTVTGTHIRGAEPIGSPLIVIGQDDIQRSGLASTQALIASLPQNFGGGLNAGTGISPNADAKANVGATSTVNLRGLGSGSTLVLVNGHRVSPTGQRAVVDISAFPLSAIERVEVLTDGASSIYGSDAIAGVVNFVLKDHLQGAQTHLQYGGATSGHLPQTRLSQIAGTNWPTGNLIATYEYYREEPLQAQDRSFSSGVPLPRYLTPNQNRQSAVIHGHERPLDGLDLFLDGLFSHQTKTLVNGAPFNTQTKDTLQTVDVTSGFSLKLGGGWALGASGLYGFNNDEQVGRQLGKPPSVPQHWNSKEYSVDAKLDGPLFTLPGGAVSAAIGLGERWEQFELRESGINSTARHVFDAFAELSVPIVGPSNARPGIQYLAVNLAGRFERYSDFGETKDPKLGLAWTPLTGMTLRGSWGSSFRAPTLYDTYGPISAIVLTIPDPQSSSGKTVSLFSAGGNRELTPETAKTFTLGADFQPKSFRGFRSSITYFDTRYTNRIGPVEGNSSQFLVDEAQHPGEVIRNPSSNFIDSVLASASRFYNFSGAPFNPATIGAFIQAAPVNSARSTVEGLDGNISYECKTPVGKIGWSINATYLLTYDQQVTPQSVVVSRLNTIFYTPDFKFRSGLIWALRGWGAAGYFNYTGAYDNNTVTPQQTIDAYHTVDAQLSYTAPTDRGLLAGTKISISVINLFDENPPYVRSLQYNGGANFGFDPANANPMGRFVTLQTSKSW